MNEYAKIIALAGNPNVGKSTIFNALTGLKQHTGNWPGKTVSNAVGEYKYNDSLYKIYDLPGTYSLVSHSEEEEIARDFICFGNSSITVIVCDAVCLERNLNLALQTIEINDNVIICVNLLDEAKRKNINVDLDKLSSILGVPVIGTSARNNKGLDDLMYAIENYENKKHYRIKYKKCIEDAIDIIYPYIHINNRINKRWLALKLIDDDKNFLKSLKKNLDFNLDNELEDRILYARCFLSDNGIEITELKNHIVGNIVSIAQEISSEVVTYNDKNYNEKEMKIDKWVTNKWTGIPLMILLLMIVFWITIVGANYPSGLLYDFLFWIEGYLYKFFDLLMAPSWLSGILVGGVYRVLAWVVSVMLPPMAIFFPLFTILEDLGYLPRIAFNLDRCFKKCAACGKQALTMVMGFGCNAVGVTGARIIDSKRERLLAIITNCFVPCNGRFPAIISIITMFFIGFSGGFLSSVFSVLILTLVILSGIFMTFLVSKILSKTLLKGIPSSFTLELPPYRKPQFFKVIVRSIFDRTLFVLGRAISIAAPAGLIIWILANVNINDISILKYCTDFLNPFAQLIGLDGVILMAFILGFPANEIVVPIVIMGYMATGNLTDFDSLVQLKTLLVDNGWTIQTAICFITFSLFHFPCSTTCLTIKKETGSFKWTLVSILIPTIIGFILCFTINFIFNLF